MRVLVTGGSGVLGQALLPRLIADGHQVSAPTHRELDLFDAEDVRAAVAGADAIYHLATRIPPSEVQQEREAWLENDRLRTVAVRLLIEAALASVASVYVQPTVTFVYPSEGHVDEDSPLVEVAGVLESALVAEGETARFRSAGGRGIVLRLGLLDGPGTGNREPNPLFGATLHVDDAGRALLAALTAPAGTYNVVRDGERVSNSRFKEATRWRPIW